MNNGLAAQRRSDSRPRAQDQGFRLESFLDRMRASADPFELSLSAELRMFLETEGLPAALEYEAFVAGVGASAPRPASKT